MQLPVGRWLNERRLPRRGEEAEVLRAWVGRVPSLHDALPPILVELRRARRHERPASVLVVGPETQVQNGRAMPSDRSRSRGRETPPDRVRTPHVDLFVLGLLFRESIRETDQLALAVEDRLYVLLLPETADSEGREVASRLVRASNGRVPLPARAGLAAFPDDGFTIEDLLTKARHAWQHRPLQADPDDVPETAGATREGSHG